MGNVCCLDITLKDWTRVRSIKIFEIKFQPNKYDKCGELSVRFNDGYAYRYIDVPYDRVKRMMYAKAPSDYFNDFIKPYYKMEKIRE